MKIQLIGRLAWQTFVRNKSQFLFSILGFALSVLLFVVIMTLGMQSRKSVDSVLTSTGTHFIAFKPQCCENPFFTNESEEGFVAQGIVFQRNQVSISESGVFKQWADIGNTIRVQVENGKSAQV